MKNSGRILWDFPAGDVRVEAVEERWVDHRFPERGKQMAKDPKLGGNYSDFVNKSFRNSSATIVAILVVNKRNAEATEIATLAKKELEDASFHQELDAALAGTFPKPYPFP